MSKELEANGLPKSPLDTLYQSRRYIADTSQVDLFVEELSNHSEILKKIPSDLVGMRIKELLISDTPVATDTGELVIRFRILGTVESFLSSALGTGDGFLAHK
jgi:hypothetical protein